MKKHLALLFIFLLSITITGCNVTNEDSAGANSVTTTTGSSANSTTTTAGGSSNSTTTTAVNTDDWDLVFADEFDGTSVDSDNWNFETGGGGWGNNEVQYYTNGENSTVVDGKLVITAKKETRGSNTYTSSRMTTAGKQTFKYGRVDVMAKLPTQGGSWPAIWMMPNSSVYGGWPNSGEIDIMEHIGNNKNKIMGTIHTGKYYWVNNNQIGSGYISPTQGFNVKTFHEYSIIWDEYSITWLVDDKVYYSTDRTDKLNPENNVDVDPSKAWPFDQEFFIILNIAVGGNLGGAISSTFNEDTMEVDYVRVYQKDYITGDAENPSGVSNIETLAISHNSGYFMWDKATDDKHVKGYNIYVGENKVGYIERNAFKVTGLTPDTDYVLSIETVDYAGKKSPKVTYNFSTTGYPEALGKIEAEAYNTMSGFEFEACTDAGGGKNAGYTDTNDYLTYDLKVTTAGSYKIVYRIAAESVVGSIKLYVDGELINTTTLIATGGWQVWRDVETTAFNLDAGVITVKLVAGTEGFNINYFTIVAQ